MKKKDKFVAEVENVKNLQRCPRFERCSITLCPLDLNLPFRNNPERSKCRFMQEEKRGTKGGKEIVFGGRVMSDEILKFVPEGNAKHLNEASQKRWLELKEEKKLT